MIARIGIGLVAAMLCGSLALAETAGDKEALLGSPAFRPTPEHPIGWRGDWTGRYPGATPPVHWERRALTAIRDLRCLGGKPASDAPAGQPLVFGRIGEWLLCGPFAAENVELALEQAFLPDEAVLQPEAGAPAAGGNWVPFTIGGDNQHGGAGFSSVEFFRGLPRPATNGTVCCYAATGIYSPAENTNVVLHLGIGAMRIWQNGQEIYRNARTPYAGQATLRLNLARGWNRFLFKAVGNIPGVKRFDDYGRLRFTARLAPADNASFGYETKNVAWMTPLPASSTALPIIVGDRIFVSAHGSDLLGLDKRDGRILWLRNNDYYTCMTDAEKTSFPGLPERLDPLEARLQAANDDLVKTLNSSVSTTGLSSTVIHQLRDRLNARGKLARDIDDALAKNGAVKRISYHQHLGSANATTCSDGKRLFSVFGGGIYSGPLTVVCHDLEGRRLWARGFADVDAGEHGNHCSPVIMDGRVVVQTMHHLKGLEADTGKTSWEAKSEGSGSNGGGSPICTRIGEEAVIIGPRRDIWRLRDGKLLHQPEAQQLGHSLTTPVLDNGILYQTVGWGDANYSAIRLPKACADKLNPEMLYRVKVDAAGKYKEYTFVNCFVGSPLLADGLVYYFTEGGVLHVTDAATGQPVYIRMLDETHTRVQWVFWNGACGSPTLAGRNIYLTDDCATTVVIEPGRAYHCTVANTLENFEDRFEQEQTYSTPVFEGKCMYYRSPNYLYCIAQP